MKRASVFLLAVAVWLGGCSKPPVTTFEHGPIRLEVSGQVLPDGHVRSPRQAPAIARGPVTALYWGRSRQLQVEIKVRFVELDPAKVDRDLGLSFTGLDLWPGGKQLVIPSTVQDITPKPPRVSVAPGFVLGGGSSRGGRGDLPGPDDRYEDSRGPGGFRFGLNAPLILGAQDTARLLRFTFEDALLLDWLRSSYLVATFQRRLAGPRIVVQQERWLMPIELPSEIKDPPADAGAKVAKEVKLASGEIVLIKGLLESRGKVKDQVPILSDIPVLKRLFRTKKDRAKRTDLIIFVRPRILIHTGQ